MSSHDTRFGTLLKVKKHQEKVVHQELVRIRTEKDAEQGALDDLQESREQEISGAVRKARVTVTDLQTSRAFLQRLSREIQKQERKIQEIQSAEDAKREELVERSKSKKMVETLEEKQRAQLIKDEERKEQRLIDVLAQRVRLEY